jgi:four helix bundle protein
MRVAVRRYQDLIAWQLADEFGRAVEQIVQRSSAASRDFRYRDQILDAASAVAADVAEGFLRCSAATFVQFLDYALGSLVEAEQRPRSGIDRGYLPADECHMAFRLARRCLTATVRLEQSQRRYLKSKKAKANEDREISSEGS